MNSKIFFFLLSVNAEKMDTKETIKRTFLFCHPLRAGDKNDLCTAVEVKRGILGVHLTSSNKFLISSASKGT